VTRDPKRREMLKEESTSLVKAGMPSGPEQIYIGLGTDAKWRLYRSPDGRRIDWLPGTYLTARDAINAAKGFKVQLTP
jgi:hypothetical protein